MTVDAFEREAVVHEVKSRLFCAEQYRPNGPLSVCTPVVAWEQAIEVASLLDFDEVPHAIVWLVHMLRAIAAVLSRGYLASVVQFSHRFALFGHVNLRHISL